jgi:hypothetical protein
VCAVMGPNGMAVVVPLARRHAAVGRCGAGQKLMPPWMSLACTTLPVTVPVI